MQVGRRGFLRIAAAVLLLTASLILPAGAGGPVTITFWHGMSGVLNPAIDELTNDFNKLNPGIVVNAQYQGTYGTLNQKLVAAVAAGSPPTITQLFPNWADQLIQAKAIVPMENFIKGPDGLSAEELSDIFPILRQESTFNGVMWTMPFNKSLYILFYNEDLFKQNNLKPPATWDDLLNVSKALTKEEGGRTTRYGFVVRPTTDYFLLMLITNGGDFLKPGGKEVAFNSPAGVEGLQFLIDLVQKHKVAYVLNAFADADFAAGKVAMYLVTNPGLAFARAAVAGRFEIGIAPIPYKKSRATLLSGTDVAIMAKAVPEQQVAAWKFIKFVTGTTATTRWFMKTFYMPVRRSARDSTLARVYLQQNPEHRAGLDSLAVARTAPNIAEWQEIRDIIQEAVEEAVLGKKTAKQALDDAAVKANKLLSQRK
ncbi:MAG: extracellular solute-binding protein family 1 [Armatimonadetes bacterium CSP1-3]|nr:MAG: extracellular solute-binding protein family 1 [Armatimonadetes bacterium CSP1-3]